MTLYRYFKGHQKGGKWKPIESGGEKEEAAFENNGYGFYTILAVTSESDDPNELKGDLYYQGPFYLDIDTDGDVKNSLAVAKKNVKRLLGHGIKADSIDIWLSGKKGFHITVPMGIFTPERPVLDLPHVYKALAKSLGMSDLDWSVYSRGKGRMWRLPSRKRIDNEKYKVICSPDELMEMTVKRYEQLTSVQSREYDAPSLNGHRLSSLETLYSFSVQKASQEKPVVATLIDDNMRRALGDEVLPPCATELKGDTNIRPGIGFNQKSVQMMKAVRAFVPPSEQKSELEVFAANSTGESYGTESSRLDHVRRSFGSIAGGTDYSWSCRSILSVLQNSPCDNCPISFLRYQQEDAEEEEIKRKKQIRTAETVGEADETLTRAATELTSPPAASTEGSGGDPPAPPAGDSGPPAQPDKPSKGKAKRDAPNLVEDASEGLTIHESSYAFVGQNGLRRVTNFVFNITKMYIEYVPSLSEDRRVAVQAQVYMKNKYVGTVNIEEDAWNSNAAFTNAFNGIGNLTFIGKDEDVRRMKSSLLADIENKAIKIRRVHSYGVHHKEVAGQDVFTYVEPGWSIDNFGHENLYSLSGKMSGAPDLQHMVPLAEGVNDPKMTECFTQLFGINQKSTIALLLGWNMASFMKQHIFAYRNEFPLVSLWGNAEAGKTQTSGLFAALHGIHYLGASGDSASPISLGGGGASTFATWTSLSESMTVPKLVEEFNARTLGRKYEEYVEHFKKCWNQHSIKRGTIRNAKMHGAGAIDAYTLDIPMTAPALLIGEQSIQIPALVHRCIQIQMNEDQRRGPGMEVAFNSLKQQYTYFDKFAKTAYMEVLGVSVKQVEQWITQWHGKVPTKIGDRPHYSYCVCLAGLSFLLHLDAKFNLQIGEQVNDLIAILIESTNLSATEIMMRKTQSEADRVMNEFAVMSELSSKEGAYMWLTKGQYYVREGNNLYLDGIAAHAQYTRYSTTQQQQPIIATFSQFKELIRHTRYCESVAAVKDGFARGRQVMKFNLALMAERGIEVQCFEE